MTAVSGQFSDLKVRVGSAVVLVLVGGLAIWAGGRVFLALLAGVAALMIWELLHMLGDTLGRSMVALICGVAGASVVLAALNGGLPGLAGLLVAPVLGGVLLPRDRGLFLVYGFVVLLAITGMIWMRQEGGLLLTIWLVLVVAAADIGGYCFGRLMGGPKILPVISPKKTWSGMLGGLGLAALVGATFMTATPASSTFVLLSVLAAFASQAGDVVESAIKRHTGVKDSSNLIPGHGGFLDRFDALIAASLFVTLAVLVTGQPTLGLGG